MLGGALRFAVPALLAALFGPGLLGDNCAAFFWLTTGFAAAFVLLFVGVMVVEGVKSPATLSHQFAFRPPAVLFFDELRFVGEALVSMDSGE